MNLITKYGFRCRSSIQNGPQFCDSPLLLTLEQGQALLQSVHRSILRLKFDSSLYQQVLLRLSLLPCSTKFPSWVCSAEYRTWLASLRYIFLDVISYVPHHLCLVLLEFPNTSKLHSSSFISKRCCKVFCSLCNALLLLPACSKSSTYKAMSIASSPSGFPN